MIATNATLFLGILVGMVIGWGATWRFARKLERHGIRLKDWDETPLMEDKEVSHVH